MLHTIGREQGKTMMLRQIDQLPVDTFFAPNEMTLQLDINTVATKSVEERLHHIGGRMGV